MKAFFKTAKKLGVEIKDGGSSATIYTPKGKVFATFFTHSENVQYYYEGWSKSEMYQHFFDIIKLGLVECDENNCEYCNSPEEEEQIN
jgi:hypothetical protein